MLPIHFNKNCSKLFSLMMLFSAATYLDYAHSDDKISGEGQYYPNPGIIAFRDGKWVGSDHLYNLTDHIPIVAEIYTPPNITIPITLDQVKDAIADVFKKARITPEGEETAGKPPLPFFHMLIMVYPIEKGYVAYCEGRLLENVILDRVKLDEQSAFEGITWESQNLLISSKDDLKTQVLKSVNEIASSFADRFRFYQDIRYEIQRKQQ